MSKLTPLTRPRCILFDLDGTLVDSVTDIATSANHVRSTLGMELLPIEELARYVGDGAEMLVRRALVGRVEVDALPGDLDFAVQMRKFRAHYQEHCLEHTLPYPGVMDTLSQLAHLPMAIVSNKPEAMCVTIADGLGMSQYFGAVIGARSGVPVKPDPALLEIALRELGWTERDGSTWMVGDSGNDIGAARAIGATAIAVAWGLGGRAELERARPDRVVEGMGELPMLQ